MSESIFKQNYFEVFSVEISTDVDIKQLKESNRKLQQQYHPDRFASASDEEKRQAMQATSLINQAFNTLKDPVLRLQYMLSLKGVDMNAETDTSMDGAFLMEQMELREDIANVRSQSDPVNALDTIASGLKVKLSSLIETFNQAYQQDQLEQAREVVRKCQFINKAQREVTEMTEQLEDELL